MSRFARISEEVFLRHRELVGENGKPAKDTLFLYLLIVLNTWSSGICEKTISEICEVYGLEYHNSTRRLKTLRRAGWIENTKTHIRPLIIHTPSIKKSVNSISESDYESVNFTPEDINESVKSTLSNCKIYTNNEEKSVDFTPAYKEDNTSFKTDFPQDTAATVSVAATSTTSNNHLSKFSIEECLRYVEARIEKGEKIDTPHRFAKWLYQTGDDDVFIRATLYPEQPETVLPATASGEISGRRAEALAYITEMKADGLDIGGLKQFYEDDWVWLMREIERQ